jgi:mevalonate kinase
MIRATAPGKLILAGEHAAVYGRPALVAAVSARSAVTVIATSTLDVRLELPDVGVAETTSWSQIEGYGVRARQAWEAYREEPGPARLAELSGGDPAHVVKVAMAETVDALGVSPTKGVRLRAESELPVGAGFGSSASVAVATIGALSMLLVRKVEDALVERVAMEVERRQHGRPSGADHTTVLHGGVQWFEPDSSGRLARRTLAFDRHVLGRIKIFHTGVPAESTGEVVEAVRRRFAGRPERLEAILSGMEADVRSLRETLASGAEGPRSFRELVASYERGLEHLGVVPSAVQSAVRRVEAVGGAAKISGAGALSGDSAGALLTYPAPGEDSEADLPDDYVELQIEFGAQGLELELNVELADA